MPDSGTPVPARTADPAGRISSIASSKAASSISAVVGGGVAAASFESADRASHEPRNAAKNDRTTTAMPTQMSIAWLTLAGFFSGSVAVSGPAPGGVVDAPGGVGDSGGVLCGLPSSVMSCPSTSRARPDP